MLGNVIWVTAALIFVLATVMMERTVRQKAIARKLAIRSSRGVLDQRYVHIGGIEQWISIRGEDRNNPAILVLHGGPGCSYSIFTPHLRAWEKHFTIVQWDQRGGGKTFSRNRTGVDSPTTFDTLVGDAIEVAEHARRYLHKERMLLLASSVGSTFGMRAARQRPDLFHAYVGTDQSVGMCHSRHARREALLGRLRELDLANGVKAIERIAADPAQWSTKDFDIVTRWTMKSDPTEYRRTMKLLKNAVWYAPYWTLKDIHAFARGMHHSLRQLLPEMVHYDAWKEDTRFEIPFFIFQGDSDVLTPAADAKAFFDEVAAPTKQFSLIMNAGHFAAFLQPEQFLHQLLFHVRPFCQTAGGVETVG